MTITDAQRDLYETMERVRVSLNETGPRLALAFTAMARDVTVILVASRAVALYLNNRDQEAADVLADMSTGDLEQLAALGDKLAGGAVRAIPESLARQGVAG